MTPLAPITSIPIDFGKPLDFSPPNCNDFIRSIQKECDYVEEEGHSDILQFEIDLLHSSLSEEEQIQYNALLARIDETYEQYDPKKDPPDSPNALAYFKAEEERENFFNTHGQHICYSCSYYAPEKENNTAAVCELDDRNIAVRPYCLACPNYFTGETPQQKKVRIESQQYFAKHPKQAEDYRRKQRLHTAERFASHLRNLPKGDHTAFIITPARKRSHL